MHRRQDTLVAAFGAALVIASACVGSARSQTTTPATPMPAGTSMADMSSPSAKENMMAMEQMGRAMADAPMTGDADRDFVGMMMPHHQGAIDMARVELKHGKDPGLRTMATDIVAAQEKEIAEMRDWQDKHPKP